MLYTRYRLKLKKTALSAETLHIESLLLPETAQERHLLALPEFKEGLRWGEPRFGHPEGKVAFHVREVLDNIDEMGADLSVADRARLRVVALAHDTFKFQEAALRRSHVTTDWHLMHHGYLARKFMDAHITDAVVLDLIEWHDEAYFCWRTEFLYDNPEEARLRLHRLLPKIMDKLDLFHLFFRSDTFTGDKIRTPVRWFEKEVMGIK